MRQNARAHTHTRARAHAHARTHAHVRTHTHTHLRATRPCAFIRLDFAMRSHVRVAVGAVWEALATDFAGVRLFAGVSSVVAHQTGLSAERSAARQP